MQLRNETRSREVLFVHSAGPQGPEAGSGPLIHSLAEALGPGFRLHSPAFPNPDNPSYEPWRARLEQVLAGFGGEIVLVGHSLGGAVLLKYLSEQPCPVRIAGLFLVAVPYWGLDPDWQRPDCTLAPDFARHLPPLPRICIYHSEGDDVVPLAHAQQYAAKLPQATVRCLPGHDHLFHAGLPALVSDLKQLR